MRILQINATLVVARLPYPILRARDLEVFLELTR
jgi:hypothetical protein